MLFNFDPPVKNGQNFYTDNLPPRQCSVQYAKQIWWECKCSCRICGLKIIIFMILQLKFIEILRVIWWKTMESWNSFCWPFLNADISCVPRWWAPPAEGWQGHCRGGTTCSSPTTFGDGCEFAQGASAVQHISGGVQSFPLKKGVFLRGPVDGRNPKQPPGMYKTLQIMG